MASIHKEIVVQASPEHVWDAVRDVGQIHVRLVPGFVTDCRLEEGARIVTFGNGMVVRELIIDLNDETRRVVWSAVGGTLSHHNASLQIFAEGQGQTRIVWIADLLPGELAGPIGAMIGQGMAAMKQTLERSAVEGK
jgi:carbon monoxide dehydrogenase subunit G